MESSRGFRVVLGILAGVLVPFAVTGVYRLDFDLPLPLWFALPFALLAALAFGLWRFTEWKSVAIGIISGSLIYGLALTLLLYLMGRGPQIP